MARSKSSKKQTTGSKKKSATKTPSRKTPAHTVANRKAPSARSIAKTVIQTIAPMGINGLKSLGNLLSSNPASVIAASNAITSHPQRYILLPANNMQADAGTGNPQIKDFLVSLSQNVARKAGVRLEARSSGRTPAINVNVVDSIHENGAKLVTISDEQLADFRFSYPGLRIIPEKFYHLDFIRKPVERSVKRADVRLATSFTSQITITDKAGNPIPDVYAVAFTDFNTRAGASGITDGAGKLTLDLANSKIERMYVYPDHTYWGFFKKNFTLKASFGIKLTPIDLAVDDSLRYFYPTRTLPAITGKVRVGIIDTGFGPHKDITIKKGLNMVQGEAPGDFADLEGHGTHVAGIIAAQGALPGMAAGVELYIYRVFPHGKEASNFDIMKAIDQAKNDQCDLVNMSLGEHGLDEGIVSSIKEAYSAGVLCIAANGNDDRAQVSFPASYSLTIAVSAMGRKGTFPPSTVQSGIVKAPYGKDKQNFIADFSNIGPETDLTAPGVGIISTYPDDKYAIMDGTSMACPAATGLAARLLAGQSDILAMPRNQARTDAIQKFLATKIKSMGFGANFEGKGMLFL